MHEELQEEEVVSALVEEGAEVVGVSQEAAAAASPREEEAVREVDSPGDVVDTLVLCLARVNISAFVFVYQGVMAAKG